jgi:lactate dehydrogenase-like 2-hydroxyacid dehydrogenase
VLYYETTAPHEVVDRCKDAAVVVTNKVVFDKNIIEQLPRLKLICVAATGTNNIDIDFATSKNIPVKNVKGYSTDSVAQLTFGLMIELFMNLSYYTSYAESKAYAQAPSFTHIEWPLIELKNKKLGIIGLGAIGKRVAELAQAFGMQVFYYSTSGKNKNDAYTQLSLKELLQLSDIVSIHAPLNEQTLNLITYDKIKWMKSSAFIINVGRGGIINEKDLTLALEQNIIQRAAIDVFAKEPLELHSPFYELAKNKKIILTPHIGWASVEARTKLVDGIFSNIQESF